MGTDLRRLTDLQSYGTSDRAHAPGQRCLGPGLHFSVPDAHASARASLQGTRLPLTRTPSAGLGGVSPSSDSPSYFTYFFGEKLFLFPLEAYLLPGRSYSSAKVLAS